MKVVGQQPTLDTSAYAAEDAAGGLLTFNFGHLGSKSLLLKRAELLDDKSTPTEADVTLHLFTDPAMVCTDQGAFTVTQANFLAGKYLGNINFASYVATPAGTNTGAKVAIQNNIDRILPLNHGTVYGQLVTNGSPTFTASQLIVLLHGTPNV